MTGYKLKGGTVEAVIVHPMADGTSWLSVATETTIEEWVVLEDGTRLLVASVTL